jgi:hypothetical protein
MSTNHRKSMKMTDEEMKKVLTTDNNKGWDDGPARDDGMKEGPDPSFGDYPEPKGREGPGKKVKRRVSASPRRRKAE